MVRRLVEYTTAAEWDALVAAHPQGHLLQSWVWGSLRPEYRPVRLAVVDPTAPTRVPRAAAQVLVRRISGFSVCYVPQGPLFSGEPALDAALLDALRRLARRHQAFFLHLEPNVFANAADAGALRALLRRARFRVAEAYERSTSVQLDLAPTADRLYAGFSRGHRRHIRRAEQAGFTVRFGATPADLDSFYAIMQATAARAGFGIFSRDYYRRAWELNGGGARLLIAGREGAGDVAALLIAGFGCEGLNMFGGATDVGLESGANYLVHWQAIRWAQERGYSRYDFWGVPDASGEPGVVPDPDSARSVAWTRGPGIYQFKKGFGGAVVRYVPAYDQVYAAPAHWLWNRLGTLRQLYGRIFHS